MKRMKVWSRFLVTGALALSVALTGCAGDDGSAGLNGVDGVAGQDGQPGQDGQAGQNLTAPATAVTAQISSVTVPTPAAVAGTVVEFSLTDQSNLPVATLPAGASVSVTLAKLSVDSAGNTAWKSYINRTGAITGSNNIGSGPGNTPAITTPTVQATTQSATSTLVALGGGNFRYTLTSSGVTTPEAVAFEATLTHRLGIQISGGGLAPVNIIKDFRPDGAAVSTFRRVATTTSCHDCHVGSFGFHGSSARTDVEYCVTCHNPGSIDPNSGNTVDMANMVHKIHAGHNLPSVQAGTPYIIWGNQGSRHDYSEVGYPMLTEGLKNCRKCHNGALASTPEGDNWKNKPTMLACGACHDDISFVDPAPAGQTLHTGGAQANNNTCASCHSPASIETYHVTNFETPNNPNTPAGVANFEFSLISVTTVDEVVGATTNNLPVVTFRMKMNGADMDLATGVALPNGITGGPNFMIAYAAPQPGQSAPTDWNQFGRSAGQPATVTLANLRSGAQGVFVDNGDGTYTGTLRGTLAGEVYSAAYPAGATLKAVGIQGYFGQTEASIGLDLNGDGDTLDTNNRSTPSPILSVTGTQARRTIVTQESCMTCHEILTFHGGNRTSNPQVCVVCHNPSLTATGNAAIETSQNLKDIIHGIHGANKRENPLDFQRTGSSRYVFIGPKHVRDPLAPTDFTKFNPLYFAVDGTPLVTTPTTNLTVVTYPAALDRCDACHVNGSALGGAAPAGALVTTELARDAGGILNRNINDTDIVISPSAAACVACHDSVLAEAHMMQNGGSLFTARSAATGIETCVLCHGPGKTADVDQVHGN